MKGLAITSVVSGILSILATVLTYGGWPGIFAAAFIIITLILGAVCVFNKESRPIAIAGLLLGLAAIIGLSVWINITWPNSQIWI